MIRFIAAAGLLAVASASSAQVPPDMAAKIRAAGASMDAALFGPLYAPLFPPQTWEDVTIERDQAYGSHPLQKLDVYAPAERPTEAPVVLFVHGGGFTRGDKHGDYSPDNMTLWAAKNGFVGVNINYRLAPDAPWPAGTQDLASAIAWTRANIARYGGDPDRIILWGHSAGANHVADYVGHRALQGEEVGAVRGAVLLSPNYALAPPADQAHVYYGADLSLNSLTAAVERLRDAPTPLFLADAEFDPEPMLTTARVLRDGLCEEPLRCPHYIHLKDHNHFTEGLAVGTDDQSLTGPLKTWIAERTSGPAARP
jgi:triacylglycerol lipase